MPAGFYYKTFLFPRWETFEPAIRAMAGLGRIDPHQPSARRQSAFQRAL